ncbi:MAG TPA: leucine-rich repeat protein [Spirochaetia bacterium]|nr:leucine-rich repeat protein [Spirochaetia bacterium]
MKTRGWKPSWIPMGAVMALLVTGCPLPFEYNGKGAAGLQTPDPSSPSVTSVVTVSYAEQGGTTGTVTDGGSFASGTTTTVTLSTATNNSVIYYTDDGTPLTSLNTAKKFSGSNGSMTITRTTGLQTLDIHALAVGPSMLPSLPVHATVSVSPYPILTVSCSKVTTPETGGTATFTITSSITAASAMTVRLLTGGTYGPAEVTGLAASGTTFTATIPQNATTVNLPITSNPDYNLADETVTLTILADTNTPPAYTVGGPSTVQLTLVDSKISTSTVTYSGNGNTSGTAPVDSNRYAAGAPVTLAAPGSLAKTGYTFTGWNAASDGSGLLMAPGTIMTMGSANVVLYAIWSQTPYSVTYNGNGSTGGSAPADGTVYHMGDVVTVQGSGTLANSGGFFVGWNTNSAGTGTSYGAGNTFVMGTSNVTLYAMWVLVSGTTITSVPQNVTNVVIPEGITDFGNAFYNHRNLVSVTLPSTISTIAVQAFLDDDQLASIVSNNTHYVVYSGALYDILLNRLMVVPGKWSGALDIRPGTLSIDPAAFSYCTNLTSITIPASLTAISMNAFTDLKSPISIVLPSTVTSIGSYAFNYSSITSITIPAGVTSIGASAFYLCPNLTAVYMQGATPPSLGTGVFQSTAAVVHVPSAAAVAAYQADPNWSAAGVTIVTP